MKERLKKVDLVIIDDDEIFSDSAALFFASKAISVDVYHDPQSFLDNLSRYSKEIKICTDNGFGGNYITGIQLIKKLKDFGYNKLYLLSGTDFDKRQVPDYVTPIMKGDIQLLDELL